MCGSPPDPAARTPGAWRLVALLLLGQQACAADAPEPVRLLVVDRVELKGRGPHDLGAVGLDAEGRAVAIPEVVARVEGPAHLEGGRILCDGTGPVSVEVRAGALLAEGTPRCVFLGSLTARAEEVVLTIGESRGWWELLDARDAFGFEHPQEELRLRFSVDDTSFLSIGAGGFQARREGSTRVTVEVAGRSLSFVVRVVRRTCIHVEPRANLRVSTESYRGLCLAEAPCAIPAPSTPACGPWRVSLTPYDPTEVTMSSEIAVDIRLRAADAVVPVTTEVVVSCTEFGSVGPYTVSVAPCPAVGGGEGDAILR